VLLKEVGTLRQLFHSMRLCSGSLGCLTTHTKKRFLGAGFLGAPTMSLTHPSRMIPASAKGTRLLREPPPSRAAAETAQPLIRCVLKLPSPKTVLLRICAYSETPVRTWRSPGIADGPKGHRNAERALDKISTHQVRALERARWPLWDRKTSQRGYFRFLEILKTTTRGKRETSLPEKTVKQRPERVLGPPRLGPSVADFSQPRGRVSQEGVC